MFWDFLSSLSSCFKTQSQGRQVKLLFADTLNFDVFHNLAWTQ